MKVLVTGANGFIGKNLIVQLQEKEDIQILSFSRKNSKEDLKMLVDQADFIFHLAGINRPLSESEFYEGNSDLTSYLCECILETQRQIPVIFSSSSQAMNESAYGKSKKRAEDTLIDLHSKTGNPITIYRLPNVFGKWSKPNYNSVVSTFCNNIILGKSIDIHDPKIILNLVYIDDVISSFMRSLVELNPSLNKDIFCEISPIYQISIGELAEKLMRFQVNRESLCIDNVGIGLTRALYATYISYLPKENFAYSVKKHEDPRGRFVEMLKTNNSGQFSYFTAHPGITRGGHYHHSKTEKFLVIKGTALFKFKNLVTNEYYELITTGDEPKIVDTATGWTHDITNIGNDEMIVMLWANEVFDPAHPDTFAYPLNNQ